MIAFIKIVGLLVILSNFIVKRTTMEHIHVGNSGMLILLLAEVLSL